MPVSNPGGGITYTYASGGFGTDPVVTLGRASGNALALKNPNSGFSALAFQDSSGVEHGAVGIASDGSVTYLETSHPTGTPPNFSIFCTFGADASQNYQAMLVVPASGDTTFYTKGAHTTAVVTLQNTGGILLSPQDGFGVVIQDPRTTGFSSIVFNDHNGSQALAVGHFNGNGSFSYITYGSTELHLNGTFATKLTADGKLFTSSLNLANLPISAAGLNPGDVWNNSGVLTIV